MEIGSAPTSEPRCKLAPSLTREHRELAPSRIAKLPPPGAVDGGHGDSDAEAFMDQIEEMKTQKNVVAIVSGMKEFETHSGVSKHACAALWRLGKEKATKTAIGKAGGCNAILTAVQTHSMDADVLDQGLGALWCLAADAENKILIVKARGVEVLLQVLQAVAQDADVHEKVLSILWNLGVDPDSATRLGLALTFQGDSSTLNRQNMYSTVSTVESRATEIPAEKFDSVKNPLVPQHVVFSSNAA